MRAWSGVLAAPLSASLKQRLRQQDGLTTGRRRDG